MPVFVYNSKTHHLGSVIDSPVASEPPGGIETLQLSTSAHILKAFAIGPKVPAMRGHAVEANHHRLKLLLAEPSVNGYKSEKRAGSSYALISRQDVSVDIESPKIPKKAWSWFGQTL